MFERSLRAPLLILLLALLARLAVALWLPAEIVWPDGEKYERVALSLYEGKGFGSLYFNSYSVPTQALLIAAVYSVFGKSYLALRLVCAVIGALSCLVGYYIARRLFGEFTARLAGVGLALYPFLVYVGALFEYPQALFMLLAGLFFLCLLRYQDEQRLRDLLLAGGLLGVATLTVPTILLIVPATTLFVLWISKQGRWLRTAAFAVMFSLPLGAWVARNYVAYHEFVLVNASSGINFWTANNETYYRYGKAAVVNDCVVMEHTQFCQEWLDTIYELLESNLTEDQRRIEWERMYWEKGMQFVRESPARFAQLSVRRFLEFWSPIPNAVVDKPDTGGAARDWISAASYTPVLLLALAGFWLSRAQWPRLIPVYLYFGAFSCAYSVFLPATRYRLSLDYFLVIVAAYALQRAWLRYRPEDQAALAMSSR
jgi:4-amino-4-deoxy-L-arabinose transferase-like glycosyltransferase